MTNRKQDIERTFPETRRERTDREIAMFHAFYKEHFHHKRITEKDKKEFREKDKLKRLY